MFVLALENILEGSGHVVQWYKKSCFGMIRDKGVCKHISVVRMVVAP